jgi:hypothetical protein
LKEVKTMETITVSLCPVCGACPEVVIEDEGVRIGEAGNTVRLSPVDWNQLVALIRSGKLPAIEEG